MHVIDLQHLYCSFRDSLHDQFYALFLHDALPISMTSSGSLSNSSGTAARPNRISVPPPPEVECSTPVSDRARARYTAASTSRTNTRSSWTPHRWAISVISRPTSPSSVSDTDPEDRKSTR